MPTPFHFDLLDEINQKYSHQLVDMASTFTAGLKLPVPESIANVAAREFMDSMYNPSDHITQMMSGYSKLTSDRVAEVLETNSGVLTQLRSQLAKDNQVAARAMKINALDGMEQLSKSLIHTLSQFDGADLFEFAHSAVSSPEIQRAVSGIAEENTAEDLEEAGLIDDRGEVRLDDAAVEELRALMERLGEGMDVDWMRVTPVLVLLLGAIGTIVGLFSQPAGAIIQTGGNALGVAHEARKGKE